MFEYGAGSSTLYWAERSKYVTSVERDRQWFDKVQAILPDNCTLAYVSVDQDYVDHIKVSNKKFDIIVLDGAVRYPCAQAAIMSISDRGLIMLDNTEWYPETAELLVSAGYTQIDFSGFPPLNSVTSTTSIFFK